MIKKYYNGIEIYILSLTKDVVMNSPFGDFDNVGIDPFF